MPRRGPLHTSCVRVRGLPPPASSRQQKDEAGPPSPIFVPSIRPTQRKVCPPAVGSDPQKRQAGCGDRQALAHVLRGLREWRPTPRACGVPPLLLVSTAE